MPCEYTKLDGKMGKSQCKNKCQKSVCWQNIGKYLPVTPDSIWERCKFPSGCWGAFGDCRGAAWNSRALAQSSGLFSKPRQLLLGSTGAVSSREHGCVPQAASEKSCMSAHHFKPFLMNDFQGASQSDYPQKKKKKRKERIKDLLAARSVLRTSPWQNCGCHKVPGRAALCSELAPVCQIRGKKQTLSTQRGVLSCRGQVQCLCAGLEFCKAWFDLICCPGVPSGDKGGATKLIPSSRAAGKGWAKESAARALALNTALQNFQFFQFQFSKFQIPISQNRGHSIWSAGMSLYKYKFVFSCHNPGRFMSTKGIKSHNTWG